MLFTFPTNIPQYVQVLPSNKLFSNFNRQKHCRILLCCLRKRIRINGKIFNMALLLFNFTIASILLLASIMGVCFIRNYCISYLKPCNLWNGNEIVNPSINSFQSFIYFCKNPINAWLGSEYDSAGSVFYLYF